jgi:hypothetical protein
VFVLCLFVGLVCVRVWVGGGGFAVFSLGFVRGLRWCSWLSVAWLVSRGFSLWLVGLSGLSGAVVGWLAGWVLFLFGVVLVVGLVGRGGSAVAPVVWRGRVPVVLVGRVVGAWGGRARVVVGSCPFSCVVWVSVPVSGLRWAGFGSSGGVSGVVLGRLRGAGLVCSLVPGSVGVVGGVLRFAVVVAV